MKRKEKGWKKAVVLMLALIMCISSIVVPQPEEVSAKAANRIDFKINGKAGSNLICRRICQIHDRLYVAERAVHSDTGK